MPWIIYLQQTLGIMLSTDDYFFEIKFRKIQNNNSYKNNFKKYTLVWLLLIFRIKNLVKSIVFSLNLNKKKKGNSLYNG
jgi:c-di-GMP-binding flagellar brake protein YcgR